MKKAAGHSCLLCPSSLERQHPLYDDGIFWIICDPHPLVQGHMLVVPKPHIAAMGGLSEAHFKKYARVYAKVKSFINACYGAAGIFEHGGTGQTVFHAHTHFLPFDHETEKIVSDTKALRRVARLGDVRREFAQKQQYLFLENRNHLWLVDTKLGYPRFFRNIFAGILGVEERSNWEKARHNSRIIRKFAIDISVLRDRWNTYFT